MVDNDDDKQFMNTCVKQVQETIVQWCRNKYKNNSPYRKRITILWRMLNENETNKYEFVYIYCKGIRILCYFIQNTASIEHDVDDTYDQVLRNANNIPQVTL